MGRICQGHLTAPQLKARLGTGPWGTSVWAVVSWKLFFRPQWVHRCVLGFPFAHHRKHPPPQCFWCDNLSWREVVTCKVDKPDSRIDCGTLFPHIQIWICKKQPLRVGLELVWGKQTLRLLQMIPVWRQCLDGRARTRAGLIFKAACASRPLLRLASQLALVPSLLHVAGSVSLTLAFSPRNRCLPNV